MNIVLIGIQGSGKGTLVAELQNVMDFELISTGQLFRDEIATGSKLGKLIAERINVGALVDTDTVMAVLQNKLKAIKSKNVVFDGFPREPNQAKQLKDFMNIDLVIHLNLSKEKAVDRLLNRLTCTNCKMITKKSAVNEENCPACGGKLATRADDTLESINKRFEIFEKDTLPLLDLYKSWGVKVVDVDASKSPKQVLEDVVREIK